MGPNLIGVWGGEGERGREREMPRVPYAQEKNSGRTHEQMFIVR